MSGLPFHIKPCFRMAIERGCLKRSALHKGINSVSTLLLPTSTIKKMVVIVIPDSNQIVEWSVNPSVD